MAWWGHVVSIARPPVVFAALLASLAGACTRHEKLDPARIDSTTSGQGVSVAASATSARTRSPGCGLTGKPTGDFHVSTTDGNGVQRDYEVLVPATYSPSVPLAVSFVFHGAGGTSKDAKAFGLQDAAGASGASIFVFPQGIPFQSFGVGWDDRCRGYDMPFFDQMLAALEANYCIDTTRVFAAGFSWGGDQATALACCRGDKLRGIAAASCTDEFANPADYQSYQNLPCPVSSATAVRFTHATDSDPGYPSPLFATTANLFRSFAGCAATTTATDPAPCRSYDGCRQPFVECAYPGLGHWIPSGWGKDSWAFFNSLPATARSSSHTNGQQ